MGVGLAIKCGKIFLVTINIIFLLVGFGLLIVGSLMQVDGKVIHKDQVTNLLNYLTVKGSLKFGTVVNSLPIFIICIGSLITLIAVLGLCGACRKKKVLLVAYTIMVLWILVVQCVSVALWFTMKTKVTDAVKETLEGSFSTYEGVSSTNEISIAWDLMFIGYKCCGVDPISMLNNKEEFNTTAWWNNRNSVLDIVPNSCCQKATESNYKTYANDISCQRSLTDHWTTGCYDAFKAWFRKYQSAAIVLGVILIVIEVLSIIFACCSCRAITKAAIIV